MTETADTEVASPSRWGTHLFKDSALGVAAVSAILYLCGSFYLGSFYGSLGLHETELHFDVPYVLKSSFLPLLHPLVFLVIVVGFCLLLPVERPEGSHNPFHPIPFMEVLAVVFGFWAVKLLVDFTSLPAPAYWLSWHRRDVLLVTFTTAVLAYRYWRNWRSQSKRPHILRPITAGMVWLFAFTAALLLFGALGGKAWPFSTGKTVFLGLALLYTAAIAILDWRKWRKQGRSERLETDVSTWPLRRSGWTTMLGLFAGVSLLLSAGLSGSVAAHELREGCRARETISFEPLPEGMQTNHTYWLLLHDEGLYYLREIKPETGAKILIVTETPGMTAEIGLFPALRAC